MRLTSFISCCWFPFYLADCGSGRFFSSLCSLAYFRRKKLHVLLHLDHSRLSAHILGAAIPWKSRWCYDPRHPCSYVNCKFTQFWPRQTVTFLLNHDMGSWWSDLGFLVRHRAIEPSFWLILLRSYFNRHGPVIRGNISTPSFPLWFRWKVERAFLISKINFPNSQHTTADGVYNCHWLSNLPIFSPFLQ